MHRTTVQGKSTLHQGDGVEDTSGKDDEVVDVVVLTKPLPPQKDGIHQAHSVEEHRDDELGFVADGHVGQWWWVCCGRGNLIT